MTSFRMNSSLIYLARHGETFGNLERIIKDPTKDFLTPRGKALAGLLGDHLSNVKFTRIYCSNYPRAIETATVAMEKFKTPIVPVIQDSRIRELEDLKYIGQPYHIFDSIVGKGFVDDNELIDYAEFSLEGCEPVGEVIARQDAFFEDLFANLDESATEETVLIVTHAFLVKIMMLHMNLSKKYDVRNWNVDLSKKLLDNCAYHSFQVSKCSKDSKIENKESSPRVVEFTQIHQSQHLKSSQ